MPILQKSIFLFLLLGLIEKGNAAVYLHTNLTDAPVAGQTIEDWWVHNIWPALQEMSWYNNRGMPPLNGINFADGLEPAALADESPLIQPLIDFANIRYLNADIPPHLAVPPTVPALANHLDNVFLMEMEYSHIDNLREFAVNGPITKHNNVWYIDKRWAFGRVLGTMDILRQRPYMHNLLRQGDLETNDIKKVQQLSGTFCKRDEFGLDPVFSGMIEAGQDVRKNTIQTIKVLTCFHGFWKNMLSDIYFVPYGSPMIDAFAFKVKNIKIGREKMLFQDDVNKKSEIWGTSTWEELFSHNDYVEAFIERKSKDGNQDLGDILKNRHLLDNTNYVLKLNPIEMNNPQNIFVFGRPGYHWIGDAIELDGYSLVTNMEQIDQELFVPYLHSPSRIRADGMLTKNNPMANTESLLAKRKAISCSTVNGMSGGPIVRCSFQGNNINCKFLGVLHGSNIVKRVKRDNPIFKALVAIQ